MNRNGPRLLARGALCAALALSLPALSGCGFTPVYATNDKATRALLSRMALVDVKGTDTVESAVRGAFSRRVSPAGESALYDLGLDVRETAVPLAVQIDDSVTRYNYRMTADYTLTRRADGKTTKGLVESVASFNVVASQYSTLFAERRARERAADQLAEQIERSILLKLSTEERAAIDARRAAGAQ